MIAVRSSYVGLAVVTDPDGDRIEVRASLRGGDEDWGGYLGEADWLAIASTTEPFFELRLSLGRAGAAFASSFDQVGTDQRVTIAEVGPVPF